MSRYLKLFAVVAVFGLVAMACKGGGGGGGGGGEEPQQGGTLKLGLSADTGDIQSAWDPAKEYEALAFEVYRCCLSRTLLSFNGMSASEGGNDLQPDLATDQPEVSDDGLQYTFTLKEGLHYGDPFGDVEITAPDFVRAIERLANEEASAGGYPFYFSVIEGFDDSDGEPGSITGAQAVDDHTLQFTLTEPTGDFAYRMTLPATTPVPPDAVPDATKDHVQDYGRFLVATGPYQWEGADALDFSAPADKQKPVAGYQPGKAWTLVRNPQWVAEKDSDELRPAYVDRIEVALGGTLDDLFRKVEQGEVHDVLDGVPPAEQIKRYQTNPDLQQYFFSNPSEGVRYLSMNLAIPPFDDVHVRKAVNFVVDRDGLRRARGGPTVGDIATHDIINSLEDDQLADYDPYPSPNHAGDVEAAKEEMKQSAYDSDGDGVCDDKVCDGVLTIADQAAPYPDQNAILQDNLGEIGIKLDIKSGDRYEFMYAKCQDPAAHAAFCPSPGWFKDYSDASTFGIPLFHSSGIGSSNYSNVGASPDLLKENGYDVTEVPSVDADVDACQKLEPGDDRVTCWANLDKKLMEEVVPWIPWLFDNDIDVVAKSLVGYTYDQSSGLISLDHVGVSQGTA